MKKTLHHHQGRAWFQPFLKLSAPLCLLVLLTCTVGWVECRETEREENLGSAVQSSWDGSRAALKFSELTQRTASEPAQGAQKTRSAESTSAQESLRKLETTNVESRPLFTRVFKVDVTSLLVKVKADTSPKGGATEEIFELGAASQLPRKIGDFPSSPRGSSLKGPSSELNFTSTNHVRGMNNSVREFFTTKGVTLNPPESLFFNDRSGDLIVRTTLEKMEAIEKILASIACVSGSSSDLSLPRLRIRENLTPPALPAPKF